MALRASVASPTGFTNLLTELAPHIPNNRLDPTRVRRWTKTSNYFRAEDYWAQIRDLYLI